jgi:hypothetical protein
MSRVTDVDFQAGMAEMASGIFFLGTDHVDAPFQENIKSLTKVSFIVIPITPIETFKLSKKLFKWIQIRRIGWQVNQFHPGLPHICRSRPEWWKNALSITRTNLGSGHLLQYRRSWDMKPSITVASVELRNTREGRIPS